MGRKKIVENLKKVKVGVSIDPDLPEYFKYKSINLSSLVNKLLRKYVENENQSL
jgi:post-segregation antitoxin (ccd killing protein)